MQILSFLQEKWMRQKKVRLLKIHLFNIPSAKKRLQCVWARVEGFLCRTPGQGVWMGVTLESSHLPTYNSYSYLSFHSYVWFSQLTVFSWVNTMEKNWPQNGGCFSFFTYSHNPHSLSLIFSFCNSNCIVLYYYCIVPLYWHVLRNSANKVRGRERWKRMRERG